MAATHTPLWRHRAWGTHLPSGDLQTIFWSPYRPSCEKRGLKPSGTGHTAPGVSSETERRWYQVRIAGRDAGENELSARLNEPLANGAVIHIVPRLAGAKSGGVFQVVLGAALIAVAWWNPVGWLGAAAVSGMRQGPGYDPGGVAQMLATESRTPTAASTDNGKQNTYISPHWITWLPVAMFCLFCKVKCAWVRVVSGDQHGRRRGRWSGCGDWSLMQNKFYVKPPGGGFVHLWSVRNG